MLSLHCVLYPLQFRAWVSSSIRSFQAPQEYSADNNRPNSRQRSPDILQTPIRHRRRILPECLARRSGKLSTIPLLCLHQLLADSPIQPLVWAPWYDLHSMLLVCDHLSLAGVRLNMVGDVCRTVHARLWYRSQISNCADICGRNSASVHPWCIGHAVACVDGVRDYGRLCVGPHLLQCRLACYRRPELAMYDGLSDVPGSGRLLFCLCLSRVAALVHAPEAVLPCLYVYLCATKS